MDQETKQKFQTLEASLKQEQLNSTTEFNKTKASIENFKKKYSKKMTIKADDGESDPMEEIYNIMSSMVNYCHSRIDGMYSQINAARNQMWDHCSDGHLPKLKASNMEKMLKNCGADGDFNVARPTLYCSAANKDGKKLTLSIVDK